MAQPCAKPAPSPPKDDAPKMTILKREPSAQSDNSKSDSASKKEPEKSLAQREKEYQAAKDRIFNESKKGKNKGK